MQGRGEEAQCHSRERVERDSVLDIFYYALASSTVQSAQRKLLDVAANVLTVSYDRTQALWQALHLHKSAWSLFCFFSTLHLFLPL